MDAREVADTAAPADLDRPSGGKSAKGTERNWRRLTGVEVYSCVVA
jgi:hypothetical protein